MIAPARRCPPFRDRDSLTGDHTEKGAACTSGEPPWPWPMPPLVSRSGDLNLRHCTITYAGDGGRSADRDPAPVHTHVQSPAATAQQVGEGRCRCVTRSMILHQEGREVAKQFLFSVPAATTVCLLGSLGNAFNFKRATACHVHQDVWWITDSAQAALFNVYSFCSELLIAHYRLMHRLLRCNRFGTAFTTSNR